MDGPRHKAVFITVPDPWGEEERARRRVSDGLEEAAEGGRWTLVSTEMLAPPPGSLQPKLLAVFRRGKRD